MKTKLIKWKILILESKSHIIVSVCVCLCAYNIATAFKIYIRVFERESYFSHFDSICKFTFENELWFFKAQMCQMPSWNLYFLCESMKTEANRKENNKTNWLDISHSIWVWYLILWKIDIFSILLWFTHVVR